ncbi:MAG: glycosyltransferase family 9 protein [Fusobacteria bacterium]|nr:glycosyltransferase family 9 protein [Fusobacteriota bacterium]
MKVLIIQLKRIGDVLLSTPLANSIKENFPDSEIDFITSPGETGVVEGNPNISEIIVLTSEERKSKFKFLKKMLYIRKKKYDVVFNVNGKLEGMLITFFSRAKKRVGWDKKGWKIVNTLSVDSEKFRKKTGTAAQTIEDRLAMLTATFGDIKLDSEFHIWLTDKELADTKALMEKSGVDFTKPIVPLGITSRRWYRVWEFEKFVAMSHYLIEKYDAQIIPFYAPNEKAYIDGYIEAMKSESVKRVETKNVRELAAMMQLSTIYFGNENGPRHVAQAVGTPSYVVFRDNISTHWFLPTDHPMHRIVTYQTAYKLTDEEFHALFTLTKEELFAKYEISLEFVKSDFDEMVKALGILENREDRGGN